MKTEQQAKKEIIASEWSVKAVKFSRGHDADCMQCNLYFQNKKVAEVWDDSWGGGFQYHWTQKLEKEFRTFAETFTVKSQYFDDGLTYNMDIVVDTLVNHYENIKQAKKILKKIAYVNGKAIYCLTAKYKPTQEHLEGVQKASWWKKDFILLNNLPLDKVVEHIAQAN